MQLQLDGAARERTLRDDHLPDRAPGESISDWLRRAVPDPGPAWTVDDADPLCRMAARLACCGDGYPQARLLLSGRPWAEIVHEHFPQGAVLLEAPEGWIDQPPGHDRLPAKSTGGTGLEPAD